MALSKVPLAALVTAPVTKAGDTMTGPLVIQSNNNDILTLESTDASARSTIKLNTNGNDWEIGSRGSANGTHPNALYIYDNAASAFRMVIDSGGRVLTPNQPAFRAIGSEAYDVRSIPVNFNSVVFNIGNHYNASTYRFVAPVAGTYWLAVNALAQNTSSTGGPNLRVNGTSTVRAYHVANERTRGTSAILYLNANDYVDVGMEDQTTYFLGSGYAHFSGFLVG